MTTAPGLRDRKKAATRAALANAAAELARDHGLHAVTADAIAARAGVSTRTFHNYFASKEEAFLVHLETRVEEWIELLRDRPRDEHILDSLLETALAIVCSSEWQFDEIVACIAFIEEGNVLSAHRIEVERRSSRKLIEIIAERTGTDPVTDLRPSLLNYAAMGAMRAAMEMYLEGSTGRSAEDLVRDAFTQLRRGFP
ncbi:TetR/AcrR family transcriptional regulator [Rhodococcus sp. Z13]|uniref:TetR/AcrR family transcriptional regulator n=1 Tax=Rhodococcus sacchari TaxID=2962047 RepID=A0ACD4DGX8_9NOCA|nr:TetR/AcrR family transcriptional regulator [Rhodococcus sp. Z13]UYP19234.1 TetR/AcrR family transcriptional regulator [Rhodococcus sp. Z13]